MTDFIANPRVGVSVASGTGIMGVLTRMGITPELMGLVATFVGTVLSLVLIVVYLRKMHNDAVEARYRTEKNKLEIEQLKWKMEQGKKIAESGKTDLAA